MQVVLLWDARLGALPAMLGAEGPSAWPVPMRSLNASTQTDSRTAYFLSTISDAPLLYMRKLSSGSLMTVLMDLRTELKVYTL